MRHGCEGRCFKERTMPQPKGGVIERLTAVSRLPWTVSLGLAPVAFVVFHVIATATATATARTRSAAHLGDMGGVAMRGYAHIFAVALQFIVPAIFLAAGCASIVRRIRSRALLGDIRRGVYTDIATLSRQDFERMLSGAFSATRVFGQRAGGARRPRVGSTWLLCATTNGSWSTQAMESAVGQRLRRAGTLRSDGSRRRSWRFCGDLGNLSVWTRRGSRRHGISS